VTAFPADAESNLFEGPYPEFFQALAHCAYPGDVRRIREAHSGWSEPREYPPLYDVQRGWDAPKTGKAFKILWLKCEDGSVRAWRRRRAQDWTMRDPYERIDPNEFRTRREEAERRMRLPPRLAKPRERARTLHYVHIRKPSRRRHRRPRGGRPKRLEVAQAVPDRRRLGTDHADREGRQQRPAPG
jgi:hypothetical protein